MAKQYDAAIKQLVEAHPADWIALAGLPAGSSFEVIDADLSAISPAADKVIRVGGLEPYIAHLEFQSSADAELDRRVLLYNVLLRWRHGLPVRSVAFLLRPQAQSPGATGVIRDALTADELLEFRYRVIRTWEQPVESVLDGGLGTLPLAPISAAPVDELPQVVRRMQQRLDAEASPRETADAWAATYILAGLRYPQEVADQLLRGVRHMEESTTYQWIIEKGKAQGKAEGKAEGELQGRLHEARSMLLRIAQRRFGTPQPQVAAEISQITDLSRLESLAERVIDASSWEHLLQDS